MFIFTRRRTTHLIRKLMTRRASNGPPVVERGHVDSTDRDVQELLENLQENQLRMLWTAVKSSGEELGHCVLVPRVFNEEPHVLCCQYWRWPDLRHGSELRRLPQCSTAYDPVYACCNPYHWSRLCQPETPPPPYSRTNEDRIRPEDRAPSELPLLTRNSYESLTTSGDSSFANPLEWCKLAYWELQERVGSLFPVEPCAVNVFGDVPYGSDGLSLATLGLQNSKATEASRKTRAKIGLGVTLFREPGGCVWLYNRSDQSVFVNSLYLEGGLGGEQSGPTRVPADHCLCIHAPGGPHMFGVCNLVNFQGPIGDPNSIRISFVKGWGTKYSRREITSCPCWLEILLAPCR